MSFKGRLAADGIWPVRIPWIMSQHWEHLLYLHYRISAEELRRVVPPQLEIEEFDGTPWLTLIPLMLAKVHLRDFVPIPGTSDFPELNLRTYVRYKDVPGVYFLSIDAASRLASIVGRTTFSLPYYGADMNFVADDRGYTLTSHRIGNNAAAFDASYVPVGKAAPAEPATATMFLAERYCMYAVGMAGRLIRGDISHTPWEISSVEYEIRRNDVLEAAGVQVLDTPPVAAYSVGTHAACWPMRGANVPQRIWPRR